MTKKTKPASELDDLIASGAMDAAPGEACRCTFCPQHADDADLMEFIQGYADRKKIRSVKLSVKDFYIYCRDAKGVRVGLDAFRRHLRACCGMGILRRGTGV